MDKTTDTDTDHDAKPDPDLERLKLWVRSGGRCAMCNKKLLGHEFTTLSVITGEGAHIIGRKNSLRSPRGLSTLPEALRDFAENLVLLCPTDHEMVDKKLAEQIWTVDDLKDLKRRHEDRIDYLTGLGEDAETVVVRLIGDIRGAGVECSAESVRAAVHEQHRYARYELGIRSQSDIEIDLRDYPVEGDDDYWRFAQMKIEQTIEQIKVGVQNGYVRHLSVFAFGRISVMVLFGSRLDDKIPTELYEHHRDALGWKWASDEETVVFEHERVAGDFDAERIILVPPISGTGPRGRLAPDLLDGAAVYELRPVGVEPRLDLIRVPATLAAFAASYRAFLGHVETTHPRAAQIEGGRSPSADSRHRDRPGPPARRSPPVRVWERESDGSYVPGIEIA